MELILQLIIYIASLIIGIMIGVRLKAQKTHGYFIINEVDSENGLYGVNVRLLPDKINLNTEVITLEREYL